MGDTDVDDLSHASSSIVPISDNSLASVVNIRKPVFECKDTFSEAFCSDTLNTKKTILKSDNSSKNLVFLSTDSDLLKSSDCNSSISSLSLIINKENKTNELLGKKYNSKHRSLKRNMCKVLPSSSSINPGPSSTSDENELSDEDQSLECTSKFKKHCGDCTNSSLSDKSTSGIDDVSDGASESIVLVDRLNNLQDDKSIRHHRKKHPSCQNCPACGITLHLSDVLKHFQKEKDNLQKWHMDLKKKKIHSAIPKKNEIHGDDQAKNLKETVQEVIERRRNRVIAQHEYLKPWKNIKCPNCHLPLMEPNDFLHHCEICDTILADSTEYSSNETTANNSGLEEAVRFAHASSKSVVHLTHAENDVGNIDIETQIEEEFGDQQYFSNDLISINAETGLSDEHTEEKIVNVNKESLLNVKKDEIDEKDIIINSLRMKIKELEDRRHHESLCAVCMAPYKIPLVSVICWHVHCEKCWLTTLKATSLCPLCKVITNVRHLRRVYI